MGQDSAVMSDYVSYLISGLIGWKNRDYDKAIENLDRAVNLNPDEAEPYIHLNFIYFDKGDQHNHGMNLVKATHGTGTLYGASKKNMHTLMIAPRIESWPKEKDNEERGGIDVEIMQGPASGKYTFYDTIESLTDAIQLIGSLKENEEYAEILPFLYDRRCHEYVKLDDHDHAVADKLESLRLAALYNKFRFPSGPEPHPKGACFHFIIVRPAF